MMKKLLLCFLCLFLVYWANGQNKRLAVIGLSGTYKDGTTASISRTYVDAVLRAGGVPVVLPITEDPIVVEKMIASVDALILTGGEDIEPLKNYGEEPIRALGKVVPERDAFDQALIKAALKRGIPVLGICRGMQLMNVALGGTLYQDIPSQVKSSYVKHDQDAAGRHCTHTIRIEPGSVLADVLGVSEVVVNSFHHQSLKNVAAVLEVTARAADGIIEAVQMKANPRVIGVQFHPEAPTAAGQDTFLPIFHYLISQALSEPK